MADTRVPQLQTVHALGYIRRLANSFSVLINSVAGTIRAKKYRAALGVNLFNVKVLDKGADDSQRPSEPHGK